MEITQIMRKYMFYYKKRASKQVCKWLYRFTNGKATKYRLR